MLLLLHKMLLFIYCGKQIKVKKKKGVKALRQLLHLFFFLLFICLRACFLCSACVEEPLGLFLILFFFGVHYYEI
ncbi:hypothetical protein TRSC58_07633 [Trypanosoma rangeli SC58]|uniref:Uncharacterized protein n=1 Tax=Trypanosoma rangeli SC58 TaxID=429131 RepID=A0A061ISH3_TRYRA|nr:hypothetical protein TRSC58_07633 [Trypanosoma rangeli SC58]